VEVKLLAFVTLGTGGCEGSISYTGSFICKERFSSTFQAVGWVGQRATVDIVVKRKTPAVPNNVTPAI
jgi:hypothetical protein